MVQNIFNSPVIHVNSKIVKLGIIIKLHTAQTEGTGPPQVESDNFLLVYEPDNYHGGLVISHSIKNYLQGHFIPKGNSVL